MGWVVWTGLALSGMAVAGGAALNHQSQGTPSVCQRVSRDAHPGGLPEGVPVVVEQVPSTVSGARVIMGAYWDQDHWSDRITYLVQDPDRAQRVRADDLYDLPAEARAAYRIAFDCVQHDVTEETPDRT